MFSFSRAQTDATLCSTHCRCSASNVSEHDSGCGFSCSRTTFPVAVARGCELIVSSFAGGRFELPDADSFIHQESHHAFQTCRVNGRWRTHSSCKLFHSLLRIWTLSLQTVQKSTRYSSIQVLLALQGACSSRRQVFFRHLQTGHCHRIALLHVHVLEALIDVSTGRNESIIPILFVPPFEPLVSTFFTRNFCFSFRIMSRTSLSSPERSSSSACTCWRKFPGSMYMESSILLGLSPRSFRCLCHGVLPASW